MTYFDILILLLSGALFGIFVSLIVFKSLSDKKIQEERFTANKELYREVLYKKEDKKYEYSELSRRVINQVHASLLLNEPLNK